MLLLTLFACSDYEINGNKPGSDFEDTLAPEISVYPPAVDFGDVDPAVGAAPRVVTITNEGEGDLHLSGVDLSIGSAFRLTWTGSPTLAPAASTDVTVEFLGDSSATDTMVVLSDDEDEPAVDVPLSAALLAPDVTVEPSFHDFGELAWEGTASVDVTVRNDGASALTISSLWYDTGSPGELSLRDPGAFPRTLAPGEGFTLTVDYAPTDSEPDEGFITVESDDPDEPSALATQIGNAEPWEGFSTGWYIVEDDTPYAIGTDAGYPITMHGDPNTFWYEPSGRHGMIATSDRAGDFLALHDYVVGRAGEPTPVTGPLTFRASSTIPCQSYASFNYILADFWVPADDDPSLYRVTTGAVDDGIEVIVNGEIVGYQPLGTASGDWGLGDHLNPGDVNTLVVILADDCAVDKYVNDLAFWRDGVIVTG